MLGGLQSEQQNEIAKTLAGHVKIEKGSPTAANVLETMAQHHLAWYYFTDGKGKVNAKTKLLAPNLYKFEEKSRALTWLGQPYYEAVATVSKDINLHVGFYAGKMFEFNEDWLVREIPLPVAGLLVLAAIGAAGFIYFISITVPVGEAVLYFRRKDTGAANLKPLRATTASGDARQLIALLESRDKLLTDKEGLLKDREETLRSLRMQYEAEMSVAKKEKTVMFLKEAENNFIDRLVQELDKQANVDGIAENCLKQLNAEFPNAVEFALFFSMNKKQEHILVAHHGFTGNPAEVYRGLGTIKVTSISLEDGDCKIVEPSKLKEQQLREIAELTSARDIIFMPLRYLGRSLGHIVIFFRAQQQSLENMIRLLNRSAVTMAKSLFHIAAYQEQVEAARTDELTGFPNKNYLMYLLPQLLGTTDDPSSTKQFAVFLVEGHDILSINDKYGRQAGDKLIQELGARIDKLLQQRKNESMGGWGDHLIRYQGAQFMVMLHSVDSKKAAIFAQRMRQVLEAEDWPCGIGKWMTSIGIANFPEDTRTPEELLLFVETALSYARGQSERNKIAHISQVPKAFRSAKLASNLGGSLDVFDPAALMQSLSISRKSGILTVTHQDGKMFWCYLENGRPTKARLGKFKGTAAIVEFLVLFDSGDFNFTDYTSIDKQTLEDIRKLDKSFDCVSSLERSLMDGALAHDHFTSAHDVIKQPELFVWPQPGAKTGEALAKLRELKDPPSPDEEKAMNEILRMANGKVTLKTIFEKLDSLPTHTVWRGAALLVQHDIVQLKKLATSIGV